MGYSKAPEQPQSSARPYMSFSRYDEHGAARTSHHMHRCIGARRATHYATGDDSVGKYHMIGYFEVLF